jgi:hypothetical protein
MNRFAKITLFLILITTLILALPGPVYAQGPDGGDSPVIFGSDYVLTSGQTIKDLVVFGGDATIAEGAHVTGDVVVFGGSLNIAGEVQGDVTAFGGNIDVADDAMIGGDLNTLGGSASISPKAVVKGNRVSGVGGVPMRIPTMIYTPGFWFNFGTGAGILSAVFGSLLLALMAVLVALFLPAPTDRVAQTIGTQPLISGAIGLLTLIVTPALFLVLVITVILIPLGLIGIVLFGIALLFGWIAVGLEFGKRMTGFFHTQWAIPVNAGVGTLVLSLVTNLALVITGEWWWTLCCIGIPLISILMMVGLGGVVASKFGANVYNPARSANPFAPIQSAAPVPPPPAGWPIQSPVNPQGYTQPPMPPQAYSQPLEAQVPLPPLPPPPMPPAGEQPTSPLPPPLEPHDPMI